MLFYLVWRALEDYQVQSSKQSNIIKVPRLNANVRRYNGTFYIENESAFTKFIYSYGIRILVAISYISKFIIQQLNFFAVLAIT